MAQARIMFTAREGASPEAPLEVDAGSTEHTPSGLWIAHAGRRLFYPWHRIAMIEVDVSGSGLSRAGSGAD